MNAIRIHKTLDSDTLHLPELKPLVGRTVEIIVLDESATPAGRPDAGRWAAAAEAARALRERGTYDFDAWRELREFDRDHANDHVR
ncbi:MAG: hypothetical protein U0746_01410 [Gemmataceae bacterium]